MIIFQLQTRENEQTLQDIRDFRTRFCNPPANFRYFGEGDIQRIITYLRQNGAEGIRASDIRILNRSQISADVAAVRREFGERTEVTNLLDQRQPLVIVIPLAQIGRLGRLSEEENRLGAILRGLHLGNTNLCIINSEDYTTTEGTHLIRHEIGHFFDDLITGEGRILVNNIYGESHIDIKPEWMNEGHNELRTIRGIGTARYYRHETLAMTLLENAVGIDALREARVSGDFREVQNRLDRIGGVGLFEQFINCDNGAEAYITLSRSLLTNLRFNSGAFENDPIVSSLLALTVPLEHPTIARRIEFAYENLAQIEEEVMPIITDSSQTALERELNNFEPRIRTEFTPNDLRRIIAQADREVNRIGEFAMAVRQAIIAVRPDLDIEQQITNWQRDNGSVVGRLTDSEIDTIRACVRHSRPHSSSGYRQAIILLDRALVQRQREMKINQVVEDITEYCAVNLVQAPPIEELRNIGNRIARRHTHIRREDIRVEALEEFRRIYPTIAIRAEQNRYRRSGISVTIGILEGEELIRDPVRGEQIYQREINRMISHAREVSSTSRENAVRSNTNLFSSAYLNVGEVTGPELYRRLINGETIMRGNLICYYNNDIDGIIIERPSDHIAIVIFDHNGQVNEVRGFRNYPENALEIAHRESEPIQTRRRIEREEMIRLFADAYQSSLVSDLGLRRLGVWPEIERRVRD